MMVLVLRVLWVGGGLQEWNTSDICFTDVLARKGTSIVISTGGNGARAKEAHSTNAAAPPLPGIVSHARSPLSRAV